MLREMEEDLQNRLAIKMIPEVNFRLKKMPVYSLTYLLPM